jgi:hypothetical protein
MREAVGRFDEGFASLEAEDGGARFGCRARTLVKG